MSLYGAMCWVGWVGGTWCSVEHAPWVRGSARSVVVRKQTKQKQVLICLSLSFTCNWIFRSLAEQFLLRNLSDWFFDRVILELGVAHFSLHVAQISRYFRCIFFNGFSTDLM